MTTKLRPSYADSVTATSWSPRPKAWVGTTTTHRAGFITRADTFTKPCAVGGGEIGAELWTSLGDGEVPGSFYFHEQQADGRK